MQLHLHFDRYAILLSGLCAIHCIALPLIASFIPFLAITIQHGYELHAFLFHQFILLVILPVSLMALGAGYFTHRKWLPVVVAAIGLIVLTVTALFIDALIHQHVILHAGETALTMAGGIIHAAGHILNMQAARKSNHQCHA